MNFNLGSVLAEVALLLTSNSQDPFIYSYPPLPDDDFLPPISDPGHEDDVEVKDGEQDGEMAEPPVIPKKVPPSMPSSNKSSRSELSSRPTFIHM